MSGRPHGDEPQLINFLILLHLSGDGEESLSAESTPRSRRM
jgi:hypothetical protein